MALITCRDLVLGYEGEPVVEGLSFTSEEGDSLCVIGENGSGKTTLMKALLGLHSPLSGTIGFGDGLKKNEVGYLPQRTEVQKDFPASVREIVLSGCQNRQGLRPFYRKEEKRLAEETMEKLGLTPYARRPFFELSGGWQQRVLLARALCATRKILLMDEPVTGLDPEATEELYRLIDRLNREEGVAIVSITHDLSGALAYAKHVLRLGREIFFGTRAEYEAERGGRTNG